MSNVVYKGKGQVPLYRIYRHSITPWGPQEGQGDNFSLGTASLLPGMVLSRRLCSQGRLQSAPTSASASARDLLPAPPSTPYEEPYELRLRRGSCPSGHVPHVWEKKYTPLNTEHMGEGRDATGEGEAGTLRGGWAEPPARPEGGTASRVLKKKKKKKIIQPKVGAWRAKELSHLYTTL